MVAESTTERIDTNVESTRNRSPDDLSYLNPGAVSVGCGWCAYEISGDGSPVRISAATVEIETPKGRRQVCQLHASMRGWRARARRVGAVAR